MTDKRRFAIALTVAALVIAPVVSAVPVATSIESLILFDELDGDGNTLSTTTPDALWWPDPGDPAVHFRDVVFGTPGGASSSAGYAQADAQGVWGNGANSSFRSGGVLTTSMYAATFVRDADTAAIETNVSNTELYLRDFHGRTAGLPPIFAGFDFGISIRSGEHGPLVDLLSGADPAVWSLAESAGVSIQGRAGDAPSPGDPDTTPFRLIGDTGVFPGTYTEDGFGSFMSEARYTLDRTTLTVVLDDFGIDVGESFSVFWQASTFAVTPPGETIAEARFWDPLGATGFYSFVAAPTPPGPTPPPGPGIPVSGVLPLMLVGVLGQGLRRKH